MTKLEACEFLGVRPRTLELYVQQGKLSSKYEKGKRGRIATYDDEELRALKSEIAESSPYPQRAMIATRDAKIATLQPQELIAAIAAAFQQQREAKGRELDLVQIGQKLTLKLQEAAALSGLSRGFLLESIGNRKLKASKRGRGWNIKRTDLDAFVHKL